MTKITPYSVLVKTLEAERKNTFDTLRTIANIMLYEAKKAKVRKLEFNTRDLNRRLKEKDIISVMDNDMFVALREEIKEAEFVIESVYGSSFVVSFDIPTTSNLALESE